MKPNLQKAVLENKMSQLDAEILSEIITALDSANQRMLCSLLANYKIIDDKVLLTELKRYNVEFDTNADLLDDSDEQKKKKKVVICQGVETYTINLTLISTIQTEDLYNDTTDEYQYCIILNKDDTGKLFACNTIWRFYSENQRDFELGRLMKKLEKENVVFI